MSRGVEYTRLGDTGLRISRLALGCMSYGDPTTEGAHRWALADDETQPLFWQAIELGITFRDTANVYQAGTSEEVTGRAIRRYSRREDIVLATKVFGTMHDGPGGSGLSRKAIMEQIDASLTRLGTDYIDLCAATASPPSTVQARDRCCMTSGSPCARTGRRWFPEWSMRWTLRRHGTHHLLDRRL